MSGERLSIRPGEELEVVFLDDMGAEGSFREYHRHELRKGGDFRTFPCLKDAGESCPLCIAGHDPSRTMLMNVLDLGTKNVYLWEKSDPKGGTIAKLWGFYDKNGKSLKNKVYHLGRESTGFGKYELFPLGDLPDGFDFDEHRRIDFDKVLFAPPREEYEMKAEEIQGDETRGDS